jgi:hypothetical protein
LISRETGFGTLPIELWRGLLHLAERPAPRLLSVSLAMF